MRQPIVFYVSLPCPYTHHEIQTLSDRLNKNHKHLVDGYEFVFYVNGTNDRNSHDITMKCIYPTFVADKEMQKLQKENLKLLNELLKDTLKSKNKDKEGILKRIFRKFKLERVNK